MQYNLRSGRQPNASRERHAAEENPAGEARVQKKGKGKATKSEAPKKSRGRSVGKQKKAKRGRSALSTSESESDEYEPRDQSEYYDPPDADDGPPKPSLLSELTPLTSSPAKSLQINPGAVEEEDRLSDPEPNRQQSASSRRKKRRRTSQFNPEKEGGISFESTRIIENGDGLEVDENEFDANSDSEELAKLGEPGHARSGGGGGAGEAEVHGDAGEAGGVDDAGEAGENGNVQELTFPSVHKILKGNPRVDRTPTQKVVYSPIVSPGTRLSILSPTTRTFGTSIQAQRQANLLTTQGHVEGLPHAGRGPGTSRTTVMSRNRSRSRSPRKPVNREALKANIKKTSRSRVSRSPVKKEHQNSQSRSRSRASRSPVKKDHQNPQSRSRSRTSRSPKKEERRVSQSQSRAAQRSRSPKKRDERVQQSASQAPRPPRVIKRTYINEDYGDGVVLEYTQRFPPPLYASNIEDVPQEYIAQRLASFRARKAIPHHDLRQDTSKKNGKPRAEDNGGKPEDSATGTKSQQHGMVTTVQTQNGTGLADQELGEEDSEVEERDRSAKVGRNKQYQKATTAQTTQNGKGPAVQESDSEDGEEEERDRSAKKGRSKRHQTATTTAQTTQNGKGPTVQESDSEDSEEEERDRSAKKGRSKRHQTATTTAQTTQNGKGLTVQDSGSEDSEEEEPVKSAKGKKKQSFQTATTAQTTQNGKGPAVQESDSEDGEEGVVRMGSDGGEDMDAGEGEYNSENIDHDENLDVEASQSYVMHHSTSKNVSVLTHHRSNKPKHKVPDAKYLASHKATFPANNVSRGWGGSSKEPSQKSSKGTVHDSANVAEPSGAKKSTSGSRGAVESSDTMVKERQSQDHSRSLPMNQTAKRTSSGASLATHSSGAKENAPPPAVHRVRATPSEVSRGDALARRENLSIFVMYDYDIIHTWRGGKTLEIKDKVVPMPCHHSIY
ncbi:hypothetical protein SCHPADRAFT_896956 [Schizopora paradoxa]|uniref:Uncharacterized protein n=1 Tax=Schizopora paradoxa TaxID=27342 RepID=A0A0H2QYR1_9AGAM|nr:hypothetical protein SCHPADRAFT_896956 [Schizopora paradoxa]